MNKDKIWHKSEVENVAQLVRDRILKRDTKNGNQRRI